MYYGFDPLYFLLLAPAMLLSAWAAWATRSRFERWAAVPNARGITGAQVARYLLDRFDLHQVRVVPHRGSLSDHYDPRAREVRLSEPVYYGASVSSLAIAAHECGHAIQHKERYAPLVLRNIAVPLASIGSNLSFVVIFIGMLLSFTQLVWLGVILFGSVVAFEIITLPVELDASSRAKRALSELGLVSGREAEGVSSVLGAAAMTYVGAALSSALTLLYYLIRLGAFSDRDRR